MAVKARKVRQADLAATAKRANLEQKAVTVTKVKKVKSASADKMVAKAIKVTQVLQVLIAPTAAKVKRVPRVLKVTTEPKAKTLRFSTSKEVFPQQTPLIHLLQVLKSATCTSPRIPMTCTPMTVQLM